MTTMTKRRFRDLPTAGLTVYTRLLADILDGEPVVADRDQFIARFYDEDSGVTGMPMWRHPLFHEFAFGTDPRAYDVDGGSTQVDAIIKGVDKMTPEQQKQAAKTLDMLNPFVRINAKAAEARRFAGIGKWQGVFMLVERPYRADALLLLLPVLREEMGEAELSDFIAGWWTDTENPHANDAWHALLATVEMFKVDRPHVNDGTFPDGADTVTAYRGVAVDPDDDDDLLLDDQHGYVGRSWTTDRDRAEWFASRFAATFGKNPVVLRAEVPRDAVIWATNSRAEAELLVTPDLLSNVAVDEEQ